MEARKDLQESLASIDKKYDRPKAPQKSLEASEDEFEFSKLSGPYTIDPEEQMERLNHPSAEDIINEEISAKLNRYYELLAMLDVVNYPTQYTGEYLDEEVNPEYEKYAEELGCLEGELGDVLFPSRYYDDLDEEYLDSLVSDNEVALDEEAGKLNYFRNNDDSFGNHNGNFHK